MPDNHIIIAQNVHRAYILKDAEMGGNLISKIIDFKEMTVGSVQASWSGNDAADGELMVYGSNFPDYDLFAKVSCGLHTMNEDGSPGNEKTQLFNFGSIGYRYMLVKYFSNANTAGSLDVMALGKKNG